MIIATILSLILMFPYWLVLTIRRKRILSGKEKRASFPLPVISLGNITAGGTGKTPMAEYLVEALSGEKRVAVLSRGYRRRTRGFRMVDTNRKRGIEALLTLPHPPEVVILDDGFQQMDVAPGRNLLLISYERPISRDRLFPLGRLRDLPKRVPDADAVIFSKCPDWLDEADRERLRKENHVAPEQPAFFMGVAYEEPRAVFEGIGNNRYIYAKEAILLAGVAYPQGVFSSLADRYTCVAKHAFADHHWFTRRDIRRLESEAKRFPLSVVMTTEKDAQRLLHNRFVPDSLKERLFYLPIRSTFLTAEEERAFHAFLEQA